MAAPCPICMDPLSESYHCPKCDMDFPYLARRDRKSTIQQTPPPDTRVRWRMTLDQLCHVTKASPNLIEEWAQLGAYGPRWREKRDRGKYRHVTREMAQRAVIMARLVRVGMKPEAAALIAVEHQLRSTEPLIARIGEVEIVIKREDLP